MMTEGSMTQVHDKPEIQQFPESCTFRMPGFRQDPGDSESTPDEM